MKRTYKLKNLSCPNCARKIEETLKRVPGVKEAELNFSLATLKIESDREIEVEKVIKSIEEGVEIYKADGKQKNSELLFLTLSLAFFVLSLVFKISQLAIVSYVIAGFQVFKEAIKNILKWNIRSIFDERFLMSTATLAAVAIKEYPEAAAVMVFYRFGEYLQNLAVDRSRRSIENLINKMPKSAWLLENGEIRQVSPQQLELGQVVLVKPGEKIPVDGVIIEGKARVDTSLITGESFPQYVGVSQQVRAGFIVQDSPLKIRVTKRYEDSTVSKLIELVEKAIDRKSRVERIVTTFGRHYTPIVLVLALLTWLLPSLVFDQPMRLWFYRSLILLVISCPCALMLAVPLTYFAGIGKASARGILIKGANFIDALAKAKIILFDKTGTLTDNNYEIENIRTENGFSNEKLLSYLASAERYSNHPVARTITQATNIANHPVENLTEFPGLGIKGLVNKSELHAGNDKFLHKEKIPHPKWVCKSDEKSTVHVAIDRKFSGTIFLRERLKSSAEETVKRLKNSGIKVKILTGDAKNASEKIARQLDVHFESNLLPEDKYKLVEKDKTLGITVFVGDGINDVPSLAKADVGIAMNSINNDAALEIADVVIMSGEPIKVFEAVQIARQTRKISIQNIAFAIGAKFVFMFLAISGFATMWQGVFADVGVALLCVLNSMRLLVQK